MAVGDAGSPRVAWVLRADPAARQQTVRSRQAPTRPPAPLPRLQEVRTGDQGPANPLYDTNRSELSAPDSPGAYGGGALPLPSRDAVSQQASMMSAVARQVRPRHPASLRGPQAGLPSQSQACTDKTPRCLLLRVPAPLEPSPAAPRRACHTHRRVPLSFCLDRQAGQGRACPSLHPPPRSPWPCPHAPACLPAGVGAGVPCRQPAVCRHRRGTGQRRRREQLPGSCSACQCIAALHACGSVAHCSPLARSSQPLRCLCLSPPWSRSRPSSPAAPVLLGVCSHTLAPLLPRLQMVDASGAMANPMYQSATGSQEDLMATADSMGGEYGEQPSSSSAVARQASTRSGQPFSNPLAGQGAEEEEEGGANPLFAGSQQAATNLSFKPAGPKK